MAVPSLGSFEASFTGRAIVGLIVLIHRVGWGKRATLIDGMPSIDSTISLLVFGGPETAPIRSAVCAGINVHILGPFLPVQVLEGRSSARLAGFRSTKPGPERALSLLNVVFVPPFIILYKPSFLSVQYLPGASAQMKWCDTM